MTYLGALIASYVVMYGVYATPNGTAGTVHSHPLTVGSPTKGSTGVEYWMSNGHHRQHKPQQTAGREIYATGNYSPVSMV